MKVSVKMSGKGAHVGLLNVSQPGVTRGDTVNLLTAVAKLQMSLELKLMITFIVSQFSFDLSLSL